MDHRQVTDLVCGRPVVETLARELREAGGGSFLNPGMLERRRLNLFPLRLLGSFYKTAQPNFAKWFSQRVSVPFPIGTVLHLLARVA